MCSHDRVVGHKLPHGGNVVVICWGQTRRGRLEVATAGIKLATQTRHNPKQHFDRRAKPLSALKSRAQRLDHLGRPVQVGTREAVVRQGAQRHEELVVAQVSPA